jgi:hypothetical protein
MGLRQGDDGWLWAASSVESRLHDLTGRVEGSWIACAVKPLSPPSKHPGTVVEVRNGEGREGDSDADVRDEWCKVCVVRPGTAMQAVGTGAYVKLQCEVW